MTDMDPSRLLRSASKSEDVSTLTMFSEEDERAGKQADQDRRRLRQVLGDCVRQILHPHRNSLLLEENSMCQHPSPRTMTQ